MNASSVMVWFRQDLRLADNLALSAAAATGRPLVPVFILEDDQDYPWGGASYWWLHHSLAALRDDLARLGAHLVLRRGNPRQVLPALARECGAGAVFWNQRHEPSFAAVDQEVQAALATEGTQVHEFLAGLLAHPEALATGQGKPYQVFTPYSKKFLQTQIIDPPLPAPDHLAGNEDRLSSLKLEALELLPQVAWDGGLRETWEPGESGARGQCALFGSKEMRLYQERRDLPACRGTSRLSPHLHWGEISPRQVWHQAAGVPGSEAFLRQLVWREFAHHLLHHFPHTSHEPLRPQFAHFPWDGDPDLLEAWQKGQTGYPLVDAGMRELWHTGWMHNRVRMVTASFLVKHLLLPWQLGAEWFWDTLVDASLANNTFGWQWTAGCGADASPYFRIFNPMTQGKKFDPRGEYIRRWVPELEQLPDKLVHEPWLGSAAVLDHLGVKLGETYPRPVVEHAWARQRALDSYHRMQAG